MTSSLSRTASAMTKTMSSRTQTHRGMLVGETHTWSGVAPSELLRSLDEGKGEKSEPDKQNDPTALHRLASPAENVITKAESPSPPQHESGSHLLWRSKSRIQENAGAEGKVVRAPELPTSEKERKRTTTSEKHELQETSMTGPYNPQKKPEPAPPSSYTHDKRYPQTPPANTIERAYSSFSRESDSGSASLPDASKARGKVGRPLDSVPSLARTGSSTSPPPTSFTTQSQPKHIARVSSANHSTISSADHRPRPSNVAGDAQIQPAPSVSPSMSSRANAPATSRVTRIDGGPPPGPIELSNSMRPVQKPHAAVVTPGSQDGPPNTRTPRETDGDTSLRLPGSDGGDGGQTHIPSRPQLDPTYEKGENGPLAKPGDRQGLVQPSGE